MSGCHYVVKFDKATGQVEKCDAEVSEDVQVIGVGLGDDEVFFAVELCKFHVIASSFKMQRIDLIVD